MTGPPELLVIAGPTASGKTAVGIQVATRIGAEIVSADSQQVYRGFDVGTAKPSPRELAAVPHHLVSIVDPLEAFSAGRFQTLADAAIASIHARGKRVIVVGGTGLYLRVLLHGVVEAPPADPALRAQLTAEAERIGRPALHARLEAVDPQAAAAISPNDLVRIVRALELYKLTGEPASTRRTRHGFTPDRYPYRLFVLDPPREALHAAIDRRMREIFDRGLLDEVRRHLAHGLRDAPAMRSVGYKEAVDVVEGRLTLEHGIELAARATRQYAKRQLTWFRKEPGARFISPPYAELRDVQ